MNQNYASSGERFFAFIIDLVVLIIVSFPIGIVVGLVVGDKNSSITNAISLLIQILYFVVYQSSAGQTIGKKMVKIQVVSMDGQKPTMLKFFLREIIGKYCSAIILLVGYIMIFWDAKKQGLHDKIAGTLVVKVGGAPVVTQPAPMPTTQTSAPAPQAPVSQPVTPVQQ